MTIGERIAKRREELNITQTQLAKKLGYKDRTSISKMEKADNMGLDRVEKVAKALNCEPSYLMGWEDVPDVADVSDHVKLITLYNKLTDEQKKIVMSLMESMIN